MSGYQKGIVRVFPHRTSYTPTDSLAFVGEPPLAFLRPAEVDEIHISVAFTWDVPLARCLAMAWQAQYLNALVRIGGPALGRGEADDFTPGCYVRPGVTFTTRGCNKNCPWCLVPEHEGRLRELPIVSGHIVQDNNLLQASRQHVERVFTMLRSQKRAISFPGGLDASLLQDWVVDELRGLRIGQLFLAADTDGALVPLGRALQKLNFLPRRKLRVYMLLAYDGEGIAEAEARLEQVWGLGGMPFAQLYQPPGTIRLRYSPDWLALNRKWSRPAAMIAMHKDK